MTKLGATNFENVFERDSKYGGDHVIDYSGGRVQNTDKYTELMGNAMPKLIQQFADIKASKLQLEEMKTGGYRIPYKEAMGNILNQQQMQKSTSMTGGGGSVNTVITAPATDASTVVHNYNMTSVSSVNQRSDRMGRGLGG